MGRGGSERGGAPARAGERERDKRGGERDGEMDGAMRHGTGGGGGEREEDGMQIGGEGRRPSHVAARARLDSDSLIRVTTACGVFVCFGDGLVKVSSKPF